MNIQTKATLGLALGMSILFPAATVHAQTTVVQPAPANPPPPATVVVPTPAQAAQTTEVDTGPNMALLTTGLVSFGIAYGSSVIVASQSNHQGDNRLYVPILGPWLDLADRGGCNNLNNSACDGETTNKVLLVIDGVVQGAGAIAVVGGILTAGSSGHTTTVADTKVHFAPVSYGAGSPGLAAFGNW